MQYKSLVVPVGNVLIGGDNPIRIQSMTNTNTCDTLKTVEQITNLYNIGCEIVRLSVPSIKDANNLINIKNILLKNNINIPLIADVHFNAKVAEVCAEIIEKVRINPGNYYDKKNSNTIDYKTELERIYERISPLIKTCKNNGTALRIGSNHGSLSDRIINKYGNTPLGMVESALEFIDICLDYNFRNIVVSMKSSSPNIMIQANKLLVEKMLAKNINFPIHLGVTEAGEGEDGSIKSAIGIGYLLKEGIGDTIRVSLTGPPELEIPIAKIISQNFNRNNFINCNNSNKSSSSNFNIGSKHSPIIISNKNQDNIDYIHDDNSLYNSNLTINIFKEINKNTGAYNFNIENIDENILLNIPKESVLIIDVKKDNLYKTYNILDLIYRNNLEIPVIIHYIDTVKNITDKIILSVELGKLIIDNKINGLWFNDEEGTELSFQILQSTGKKITRNEYISCPTCARTNYDINKVLAEIKALTKEIKGLKIGIMGCIVNGPGEMADADFGCVGSGNNKVTLYIKNEPVLKNIKTEDAAKELYKLIKSSMLNAQTNSNRLAPKYLWAAVVFSGSQICITPTSFITTWEDKLISK